jgi:hypothetical protein
VRRCRSRRRPNEPPTACAPLRHDHLGINRLHKEIATGPPYGMQLPDACAEGLFQAETGLPLVEYLNWVFRRAGFPHYADGDELVPFPRRGLREDETRWRTGLPGAC